MIVESIRAKNPDIESIEIGFDSTNSIVIEASTDNKRIGGSEEKTERYSRALIQPGTPIAFEYFKGSTRYWETTSTLTKPDGSLWYVITVQNFREFDALIDSREWQGYTLLVGSFAFLLLLALWHVRNIDYEKRFMQSQKDIDEQNQISNMIAHELRAPLTAMRGYASMILEQSTIDTTTREYASRIDESTTRLVKIVNDFLDVARLQSGKLKLSESDTDVVATAHKVVEELQPLAMAKGLEINLSPENQSCLFFVDEARLHQILTNIVSNAIKYTQTGRVTVEITTPFNAIEFRVKDTGAGIDAENQRRLFTPFFRVENSNTDKIIGTGLGMWITKKLVDSLGGTIGVESIKNIGTNVVITLPRRKTQKL